MHNVAKARWEAVPMAYLLDNRERRRYERIPASFVCHLRQASDPVPDSMVVNAITRDISLLGVFVESNETWEEGETVEIELLFPRSGARVTVTGMVRWCRLGKPRGIGIEFIKVETQDKDRIKQYIEWLSENQYTAEMEVQP